MTLGPEKPKFILLKQDADGHGHVLTIPIPIFKQLIYTHSLEYWHSKCEVRLINLMVWIIFEKKLLETLSIVEGFGVNCPFSAGTYRLQMVGRNKLFEIYYEKNTLYPLSGFSNRRGQETVQDAGRLHGPGLPLHPGEVVRCQCR